MKEPTIHYQIGIGSNYATAVYGKCYERAEDMLNDLEDGDFVKIQGCDDVSYYSYSDIQGFIEIN